MSLVNPSHPYHLRSRSRDLARGAQVAGGSAPADARPDQRSDPDLTPAVEGARGLRPRKVVKYTYTNTHKQLRFNREVFVREFNKKLSVVSCLGPTQNFPSSSDGYHVNIAHYIPNNLQFDPTLSRREIMLILSRHIKQ